MSSEFQNLLDRILEYLCICQVAGAFLAGSWQDPDEMLQEQEQEQELPRQEGLRV